MIFGIVSIILCIWNGIFNYFKGSSFGLPNILNTLISIISLVFSKRIIIYIKQVFSLKNIMYIVDIISILINEDDVQNARKRDVALGKNAKVNFLLIMSWMFLIVMICLFLFYKSSLYEEDIELITYLISMCVGIIAQSARFEFGDSRKKN